VPWVVAAAAIAGVVMVSVSPLDSGSTTTAARFLATTSDSLPIVGSGEVDLAISPDGTTLVYSGGGPYGVNDVQLVRRSVDDLHAMPIEGGGEGWQPFFSPDGQWVGYATYPELALMRLPIEGGAPVTIMPPEIFVVGATWAEDDTIIFTLTGSGLYQIPVSGGEAKSLTAFDETVSVGHRTPRALPGGRGVLFFVQGRQRSDDQVAVLDLDTGDWRTLMPGSGPRYAETGHLVYALAGDLYAAPFDLATLTVTGAARVVVSGIMVKEGNGNANFALSRNGTLVYAVGGTRSEARSCG